MKIDNRIILYVDGQMNEEEKSSFEKELNSSPILKVELEKYKALHSGFSDLKNISVKEDYFIQMVPRFRGREEQKKRMKYAPKIALGMTTITAVIIIAFLLMNRNIKKEPVIVQNSPSQVTSNVSVTDLNALSDQYNLGTMSNEEITNSNSILDSILVFELKLTPQTLSSLSADNTNTDISTVVQGIDEKEAVKIYNELLHKRIF